MEFFAHYLPIEEAYELYNFAHRAPESVEEMERWSDLLIARSHMVMLAREIDAIGERHELS